MIEELMVRKANALVEAKYRLSLEEQRLILYLVSLIDPCDENFKKYKISIKDFCKLTNLATKNQYGKFKKISKSLLSKTIEIKEVNDSITLMSWLYYSNYDKGSGYITVAFAPELKPYLLQLKKNFTRYNFTNISHLKSVYSGRVFELLKQYEKIKSRTFELEKLKELLLIQDVKSYNDYYDFKKKVILPAQRELKEKCDIYFDFEEVKTGRKVTSIKFNIFKNKNKINKVQDEEKVLQSPKELKIPVTTKKNGFHNFPERQYTQMELSELEMKLLRKQS